jgi:hypothetical protein
MKQVKNGSFRKLFLNKRTVTAASKAIPLCLHRLIAEEQ